jgi:type II secretory pathway component GspD/PulD (secretin)
MSRGLLAVALAAGICAIPALAEKKKAAHAPETIALSQLTPVPIQPWTPDDDSVVKVYAVADLVVPPPPVGNVPGQCTQPVRTCEAQLIEKIISAVEPKSWSKCGGKGTIEYYPIGMALVVNQSPVVQTAVERFLDNLRKMQDRQVTMELRLLTVSDAWFEKSGLARAFAVKDDDKPPVKCLTPTQVEKLLTASQHDPATNVMAAPRLTTLNGQPGTVKIDCSESFVTALSAQLVDGHVVFVPKNELVDLGVAMQVEPVVSDDGKSVRLCASAVVKELAVQPVPVTPVTTLVHPVSGPKKDETVPFTQCIQDPKVITRKAAETVTLPDGNTALLYAGKATIEKTVKEPMPTLADVPVLAAIFTQAKKQTTTNHLLVMVTTRIIHPECNECCCKVDPKLAKLLDEYSKACKEGKTDDARRLAIECLAIDPMCFARK